VSIVTLKKGNDPEYKVSTHTNSEIKENKEVGSIEDSVCKNTRGSLFSGN